MMTFRHSRAWLGAAGIATLPWALRPAAGLFGQHQSRAAHLGLHPAA